MEKEIEKVETVETTETVEKTERKPRKSNEKRQPRQARQPKLYDEEVISIGRVTKVTKGGRHFRFSAVVVVGDRKGKVGLGTGKSNEVPDAIKKASQAAAKNMVKVSIVEDRTIPHEATGVCGASKVMLRPAKAGRGIIAGGASRIVLELVGVKDVVAKSLGSNTQINTAKATIEALQSQRSISHVAELRGKTVEEVLY